MHVLFLFLGMKLSSIYDKSHMSIDSLDMAVYHDIYQFSADIQMRRSVFNSRIARAISWESGLPMTLIPSQFKEMMRFDSFY